MHKSLSDYPDAPDIESATADYARRFTGDVGRWFLDVQETGTRRLLASAGLPDRPLRVLDVGGGHGQNIELMAELGHELTIAGSHASCSGLIRDAIEHHRTRFVQAPLTDLPFDDGAFDVVLCYRVMAHIDDWPALVKELTRVSARLVIVDFASRFSVNAISGLLFRFKKNIEANTRHYRLHEVREVKRAFTEAGASFNDSYKQFLAPMALHRALASARASQSLEAAFRWSGLTLALGSPILCSFVPPARTN